jgi:hypothetical protein
MPDDQAIGDHHHALAIGGAHHAFAGGHISAEQRDTIIQSARTALARRKTAAQNKLNDATPGGKVAHYFGSLSPPPPWREGAKSK